MASKAIRNRMARFRKYELCQICVPPSVGEYILSVREYLRDKQSRVLYERLKEQHKTSPNYAESRRLQYLYELMWVLNTRVSICVDKVDERECVPTNYLEREDSSWGHDKVQPCWVLSLQVQWGGQERKQLYESMQAIVEGKMRHFKTDFYFHDMMTFSRDGFRHPFLWTVNTSHTMNEVLDAEGEAAWWVENIEREGVRQLVYGDKDDTWMGSALRVMCYDDDLYYYHDGAVLHRVSREKFTEIHNRHVERAKAMAKGMLERKAA